MYRAVFFYFCICFQARGMNNMPSDRACMYIHFSTVPKSCLRSSENKKANSFKRTLQPCLISHCKFKIIKHIHIVINIHVFMMNSMRLCNYILQHILVRILNRQSLLTRLNAFIRLIKKIYNCIFCSLHFSCS